MRKSVLASVAAAGAMGASAFMSAPASAWDDCGYRSHGYYYGYASPRVYSYAYAPRFNRYRPAYYYGAAYYRPAVWGWRGDWGWRRW